MKFHVIPTDNEDDVSNSGILCSSMPSSSSRICSSGHAAMQHNNHPHQRMEQELNDLRNARRLMCLVASSVLRNQTISLNKNLTNFHQRAKKRRSASTEANSEAEKGADERKRKMAVYSEAGAHTVIEQETKRYRTKVHPDSPSSNVMTMETMKDTNGNHVHHDSESSSLHRANDPEMDVQNDEKIQVMLITTQAHRLRKMSTMFFDLENMQKKLMNELSDLIVFENSKYSK